MTSNIALLENTALVGAFVWKFQPDDTTDHIHTGGQIAVEYQRLEELENVSK